MKAIILLYLFSTVSTSIWSTQVKVSITPNWVYAKEEGTKKTKNNQENGYILLEAPKGAAKTYIFYKKNYKSVTKSIVFSEDKSVSIALPKEKQYAASSSKKLYSEKIKPFTKSDTQMQQAIIELFKRINQGHPDQYLDDLFKSRVITRLKNKLISSPLYNFPSAEIKTYLEKNRSQLPLEQIETTSLVISLKEHKNIDSRLLNSFSEEMQTRYSKLEKAILLGTYLKNNISYGLFRFSNREIKIFKIPFIFQGKRILITDSIKSIDSLKEFRKMNLDLSNSVSKTNTIKTVTSSYGYLKVNSEPSGMEVYLSGHYGGKTPIKRLKVDSGYYKLVLKDSNNIYQDYTKNVEIKKFALPKIKAYMVKHTASLFFLGEESGRVIINGNLSKFTVPGLVVVPTGKVFIEIVGQNKGFNKKFNLQRGQEIEVEYFLSRKNAIDAKRLIFLSMGMVKIPSGSFIMGSSSSEPNSDNDERPQHKVKISKSFYMGRYEVTQKQYKSIMGINPSKFKGENLPIEMVNWSDIQKFLIKLNKKVGCIKPDTLKLVDQSGVNAVPSGCFRLPTEAEWEYAARAGTKTAFAFGNNLHSNQANYFDRGSREEQVMEVGSFKPNNFGLYDMHGNAFEFCHDRYDKNYYKKSPLNDPVNTGRSPHRVKRGGSGSIESYHLRSASRSRSDPKGKFSRWFFIGFRLLAVP